MNLSFTKDPQWIEQRTLLWNELEPELKNGLSRKEVERWREYFFTGSLPPGKPLSPFSLLNFFPQFDDVGIQYCLQNVVTEDVTSDQFFSLQTLFAINLKTVPGLDLGDAVRLFESVFGKSYDLNRTLPYILLGEDRSRKITLSPNLIFAYGSSVYSYIKRPTENLLFWVKLPGYFLSLIPHVDTRLFDLELDTTRTNIGGANLERSQGRFQAILRWSVNPPKHLSTSFHQEEIFKYLADIKAGIDGLDEYPGQLKELWEGIKAEYSE